MIDQKTDQDKLSCLIFLWDLLGAPLFTSTTKFYKMKQRYFLSVESFVTVPAVLCFTKHSVRLIQTNVIVCIKVQPVKTVIQKIPAFQSPCFIWIKKKLYTYPQFVMQADRFMQCSLLLGLRALYKFRSVNTLYKQNFSTHLIFGIFRSLTTLYRYIFSRHLIFGKCPKSSAWEINLSVQCIYRSLQRLYTMLKLQLPMSRRPVLICC